MHVLITGASSGIGEAIASLYLQRGDAVTLVARRKDRLDELAATAPGRAHVIAADLAEPERAPGVIEEAEAALGPLDVLVNNAAATFIARSETLSARAVDAVLAPTLHGALHCTLEAGRRWIGAHHRGTVLSILSTSTITGRAFTMPSAVAKSGVLAMTRSLAAEWGPHGIRLVAIAPGPFPTQGSTGQLMSGRRSGRSPGERIPLGRAGDPHELANLASYLVSDQAGYITGEMVTIDGGGHLRSSGAEDLFAWTDADWNAVRPGRR